MYLLEKVRIIHELIILPVARYYRFWSLMDISSDGTHVPIANLAEMMSTFPLKQSGWIMITSFSETDRKTSNTIGCLNPTGRFI